MLLCLIVDEPMINLTRLHVKHSNVSIERKSPLMTTEKTTTEDKELYSNMSIGKQYRKKYGYFEYIYIYI